MTKKVSRIFNNLKIRILINPHSKSKKLSKKINQYKNRINNKLNSRIKQIRKLRRKIRVMKIRRKDRIVNLYNRILRKIKTSHKY